MSTELGTIHSTGSRNVDMKVTRYYGGDAGPCFQLTAQMENGEWGYVQLTVDDVTRLVGIVAVAKDSHKFSPSEEWGS
jgi:hypothetical protein